MTTRRPGISEEELHAFIDGELDVPRATEIRKALDADDALAQRVAAFRSDKYRLLEVYRPAGERPLPEQWLRRIDKHSKTAGASGWRRAVPVQIGAAIAAGLLILLGWTFFSESLRAPNGDAIISEAVAARQDRIRPEQTYAATRLLRSETPDAIMSAALSMNMKAPNLAKMGYRLDGIRVYAGVPGGKAVELDYRNAQAGLFTLYLRRPTSPPQVDIIERDGLRICIWQDDVVSAVMAGQMAAGEMARIAALAYAGL